MRKSRSSALVAITTLFTLFAAGCDESSTGNTGDPLTQDEAEFLAATLFLSLLGIYPPIQEFEGEFEGDIDVSEVCDDEMGTVEIVGDYSGERDSEAGTGNLSLNAFLEVTDCFTTDEDDVALTVTTDPSVELTVDEIAGLETYSVEFTVDGALLYETEDDRSGRCVVDLSVGIMEDESGEDVTATGSACGVPASELGIEEIFSPV